MFRTLQFSFAGTWSRKHRRTVLGAVACLLALSLLSGCNRDLNVRKQKYLESGQRYSAEGKYREAAIQLSNALKIDKDFADAHYELAQVYVHMGALGAAYGELVHTVELAPKNYKARIDLGSMLLAGGKTDEAQEQANAVMAAQPDNPDVHALLSRIADRRGKKDLALAEIHRALEIEPNRPAFHEVLALLQEADPTQNSAVEIELKKSISLDPKSANAKLLLASFYTNANRWPEAEQAAREAISTDPKSLSARASLAQVFLKQGNSPKAEEVLRQASNDLADNPQGVRLLADYYASIGDLDKAKAEFVSLVAKYPKNVSVQLGYVRVLLASGETATAENVVTDLVKANKKDPQVAALNGIVLLNNGKPADAVIALTGASRNYPKDPFIQYWLGKAAQAKGDNALAERSFRQAATLNPTGLEAQQELARIAAARGDTSMLGDVAEKTIAAAPRFPGGYVWRANVEWVHHTADKAEADLKTAISVSPRSPQPYVLLGQIRFAQQRYPEGAELLEQALQLDPDSVDALRGLVGYDLFRKQPAQGLARLHAQIAKSPKNSRIYDLLAQFQIQTNNIDAAAATAQKAMEVNPEDGDAVALYAQLQVQRKQLESAVDAWEHWAKAHPNNANALAVLGTLEESRGDLRKAETYYTKALQIQPKQPVAANNLAYRMLENGENVDVALSLAQIARQAMPTSTTTADTLAWAYYHKGAYAFARDLLEDAVKTTPDSPAMQYHLGMVYSGLRDKNNALIHLKKAVSLAPDSPAAKDAQAALQRLG